MGKAGRFACILTPMALTIASLVCLILTEIAGWNPGLLNDQHFFQANITDLTIPNNAAVTEVLSKDTASLPKIYQIHLWNYCSAPSSEESINYCSPRKASYAFDPLTVWGLQVSDAISNSGSSNAAIMSAVETIEEDILGPDGQKALDAYQTAAKWMFIGYQVALWTTVATIVMGILAIFSRWGSFFTWLLSVVSTFFTVASVTTSTVLFSILVEALNKALESYQITLALGTHALITNWLGVAFSLCATLFWLFSVCCCSGRTNPHHYKNKNGLWNAEPKGQGYGRNVGGNAFGSYNYNRGPDLEKAGKTYQPIPSPYAGAGGMNDDHEPLSYSAEPMGNSTNSTRAFHQGAGYEPYRHQ